MAKKDNDAVLDKKTREQFKQDIMQEINTKYKEQICSSVVEDVKLAIDDEYKEELKNQITSEIKEDIKKDIAREQKKVYRSKSFKIFRLYIYILLLIAISGYMIYCLYQSGNFDLLKNKGKTTSTEITKNTITTTVKKDFNWYLSEYGNLLNKVRINDYNLVSGNVNLLDLPNETRLSLAYQLLGNDDIVIDGSVYSISEDNMINVYKELYGSEDGYRSTDFTANGLSYAYLSANKSYIAIKRDTKELQFITNKITEIKENNGELIITAIIAIIIDGKVYSIDNLEEEIGDYGDLTQYSESLTKVDYVFRNIEGNYYINSIVKR